MLAWASITLLSQNLKLLASAAGDVEMEVNGSYDQAHSSIIIEDFLFS